MIMVRYIFRQKGAVRDDRGFKVFFSKNLCYDARQIQVFSVGLSERYQL